MSKILTASWADLGYRRCGPLPESTRTLSEEDFAARLRAQLGYDVIDKTWVRRRGRAKTSSPVPCLRIRGILDRSTSLGAFDFSFIDEFFRSPFGDIPLFQPPDYHLLVSLVESTRNKSTRPLAIQSIVKAFSICRDARLIPLLRDHILPWFFDLYPDGRLVIIQNEHEYERVMAGMRCFYTIAQVPFTDIEANTGLYDDHFPTLKYRHSSNISQLSPPLLDFWTFFFLPSVLGFRGDSFGMSFLFLFGEPETQRPPNFPSEWVAMLRAHAAFGAEPLNDGEFEQAISNPNGPEAMKAAHQPPPHSLNLPIHEQVKFLEWYIDMLNRYLFDLTDIANFTEQNDPSRPIQPIAAFEHYLTIERLVRRTIGAMAATDLGTGKNSAFEIADLFDTLSMRFGKAASTQMFKRLFNPVEASTLLCDQLSKIPGPVGTYLCSFTQQCYATLQSAVYDSVWLKSKAQSNHVLVRDNSLTAEVSEPIAQFVGNVMRAYRNGHHGYFSSPGETRPSRYLFLVDGRLPDVIVNLPSLWLLAYLIDPNTVGWGRLGVSEYD